MTTDDVARIVDLARWRAIKQRREERVCGLAGFPTLERNSDGSWNYWAVSDTGDWVADYARGSLLAMETCVYLTDHSDHAEVIWEIIGALPPRSAAASGFRACLERLFLAFGAGFKASAPS